MTNLELEVVGFPELRRAFERTEFDSLLSKPHGSAP
jgi:hypothetical protein